MLLGLSAKPASSCVFTQLIRPQCDEQNQLTQLFCSCSLSLRDTGRLGHALIYKQITLKSAWIWLSLNRNKGKKEEMQSSLSCISLQNPQLH